MSPPAISGRPVFQHMAIFGRSRELAEQLARLARELEAQRGDAARVLKRFDDMRQLVRANTRAAKTVERALARSTFDLARARALRQLEKLAASLRPIVVGPWYGEVGYELLYWAPFVRWAVLHHNIDLSRIVIMSRGGSRDFYGLDVRYVDLFDHLRPHKLRAMKAGQQKQYTVRGLDRSLVRELTDSGIVRRPHLLHPSLMYATLETLWDDAIAPQQVLPLMEPHRITPARLPDMPEAYVAVRFYSCRSFPAVPENTTLVAELVRSVAAHIPVVVLTSGTRFDDHGDFPVAPGHGVSVVDVGENPSTNLALQASVIAHAQMFIGNFGGTSYIGPLAGVPALALWSHSPVRHHHVAFADALFQKLGGGRFSVVSATDLHWLLDLAAVGWRAAPTP